MDIASLVIGLFIGFFVGAGIMIFLPNLFFKFVKEEDLYVEPEVVAPVKKAKKSTSKKKELV